MSLTFDQFTPVPKTWPGIIEFARPTPTMAPMSVCELEAGRPKYQVPRFQAIAATSSASTMARPAPLPLDARSSTGSSLMMLIATAMPPRYTPAKLQRPERMTAYQGFKVRV